MGVMSLGLDLVHLQNHQGGQDHGTWSFPWSQRVLLISFNQNEVIRLEVTWVGWGQFCKWRTPVWTPWSVWTDLRTSWLEISASVSAKMCERVESGLPNVT